MNKIENKTVRIKIAQKAFKKLTMLNINACLEYEKGKAKYAEDVIYIELFPMTPQKTYDSKNKISMKYNSFELRGLAVALKELFQKKETSYVKHTDPSLSSSSGNKKTLSISTRNSTLFSINIAVKGATGIFIEFDKYEIISLAQCIEKIADEVDTFHYNYQQYIDKQLRSKK
ncbi:hypothetical protein CP985_03230 [Malaciobacter mytili LMG 24559]|uniref:Uncharacterized protein n=1 Tax=Malaciobacter mytili LMG 24559 TaxID=1032238 RepID=A0AAX2AL43_9BACT|nr:hypothetical protein [Malaciobacter mytili]AXH16372.1 hypothetical protein AMYT_a0072 [Malaciobacter mytili LMG 24559]RXK16436.1 hypothetical protein CP985_03230 [Malaciobacter mytili LMG 24559]